MKRNNKVSVTLAISAYNEEKNIYKFLMSVLAQKEQGFVLKQIWIYSDGSTDKTAEIARSIKSEKIKVIEYEERIGKSARLNEIYKNLDTDILVQSDSDVIVAHPNVIRDLIAPLKNKEIAMCGGNPLPVKANTFIEKAINITVGAYLEFRKKVRGGNNVFSADGRLLAFKKKLVKKIYVPPNMIANDMYTYYSCLSLGYKYKYVDSAVVKFRSPQTLRDHIKQNTRFRASPIRMKKYFSERLVDRENNIPAFIFFSETLKQFIKHPVLSLYIYIVNKYCHIKAKIVENKLTAKWPMANTTKELTF
ncbi:MAG: glycosyltransferase [Candidatus Levybacteria bacterium]|nr:glycosyltransferase [Candidatus Levybacteria bacterium]